MLEINIPEEFNIGQVCTNPESVDDPENHIAIIVDNNHRAGEQLTYAQLRVESDRFGHGLLSNGIQAGDRVMLWLPNCLEFPIAFFGCLKIGAIAVPVSTMLTGEEIEYLLTDSGASLLVTTGTLLNRLDENNSSLNALSSVVIVDGEGRSDADDSIVSQSFNEFLAQGDGRPCISNTRANDPAYLVYTSGTTGFPKGVLHAHRALLGRTPAAEYWFDYGQENDRILHSGKFNWTYVLGTALMDPLFQGKTVVVYEGQATAETWMALVAKYGCTIFIGVPTIYRQILQKTQASSELVPTLRHCMCAGEHLSDDVLNAWKERFKLEIYEAIGMSECSYYLSQSTRYPIKAGSAGLPQPGHKLSLLDDRMQPVADNQEGMLCIRLDDPGLFIEYWQKPEETKANRRGGFFLTGDYARRDEDGYIWFMGRKDDIINSFGYRISPMEVERVMKGHPDVADCVATEENVGPDKTILVCFIINKEGQNVSEAELIRYAGEHLASYKVPKKIRLVDSFPRTPNGKVLRGTLKKM